MNNSRSPIIPYFFHGLFWIRVLVGLFGFMLCSSGKEGGCEWSVGCASPIHHESRPSPPNIHQHPDLPPVRELGKGERGVPRVRMGRKRERECSPWKKGENECAMSAPRNQDRMVPPSNATPSHVCFSLFFMYFVKMFYLIPLGT